MEEHEINSMHSDPKIMCKSCMTFSVSKNTPTRHGKKEKILVFMSRVEISNPSKIGFLLRKSDQVKIKLINSGSNVLFSIITH